MRWRRGFAIQRLMNTIRQAAADGWIIVFHSLTLTDGRSAAFYDQPIALPASSRGREKRHRGRQTKGLGVQRRKGRVPRQCEALVRGQTSPDRSRIHRRGGGVFGGNGQAIRDLPEGRHTGGAGEMAPRETGRL